MQTEDILGTPINSFKSPPSNVRLAALCESRSTNIMNPVDDFDDRPIKPASGSGGWESIRQLDDEENWSERNCVISKHDHQLYSECAQEFVSDIIDKLPARHDSTDYGGSGEGVESSGSYLPPPSPYDETRDLVPIVHNVSSRNSDDDTTPLPPPPVSYNTGGGEYDYMKEMDSEVFQTTSHQLDMDYLEKLSSNSNPATMSALARESLYVKFDPLVGKTTPIKGKHRQRMKQMTAAGSGNLLMLDTPPQVPSNSVPIDEQVTYNTSSPSPQESNILLDVSAPSSAHHTSAASLHTPTSRFVRESSPHSKTLFDTSPASLHGMQTGISPAPPSSHSSTHSEREDELVKVLIYSESDLRKIVEQVRNESLIQNEETVALIKADHAEELSKQQKKIDRLVKEVQNLRAHSATVRMDKVIGVEQNQDYEELCSKYRETEMEILDAYEQLKTEAKRVEQERDQSLQDFASLERSFTDFHQRYNKSKELVTSLQKTVSELQDHIRKNDNLIKKIKSQNTQLQEETVMKLQEANETFEHLKKETASEVAVMKANGKKLTVQLASLERQLQQKEQEKAELTQICEDLMKELSSKS